MTIGTAIFLSSLLLSIVVLYGLTKDRWAWRRIVKRTAVVFVGIIFLGVLFGAGFYVWKQLPTTIEQQIEYASVRIGMNPAEVKYVKGYPPTVYGAVTGEGDWKGSQLVIETKDMEKGKRAEDYEDWSYKGYHHRIDVQFDPQKTAVIAVQCYSEDKLHRCPAIAGIADGDSEEEVIRRLGAPDSSNISGVAKSLYYSEIGVFFTLTQERVYMVGINDIRYRKR